MNDLAQFADPFLQAFRTHKFAIPAAPINALSLDDAYRVQRPVIQARTAMGEFPAGNIVGCTSAAMRKQFGLTEPINGGVVKPHVHHGNVTRNAAGDIQPAIEPEFVRMMSQDMPNKVGADDDRRSTIDWVAPGIEVHNDGF